MCTDSVVSCSHEIGAPAEEIEITPAMIEAGLEAFEKCHFTSMEGYDMLRALPLAFKAMSRKREESRLESTGTPR